MNNTRYIFDPGLPGDTGFFYPMSWEPLSRWPSTSGKQAEDWDDYLTEEDKAKPYFGTLSLKGGKVFYIFVNSSKELLEYMKEYGIEVITSGYYNTGNVQPRYQRG
jgi:hypothetical protein